MVQRVLIVCLLLVQSFLAHGFSLTVTGASSSAVDDTTNAPSTVTINAGYAIPANCGTKDDVNPCNSCNGVNIAVATGTNAPAPCNENSIYDSLPLVVAIESDQTTIGTLAVGASTGTEYDENPLNTIVLPAVNGQSYVFRATWAQIAAALGFDLTCTSSTAKCGGTQTIYFGPVKDGKYVEKVTLKINLSVVSYSASATYNNDATKALATYCPPTSFDPLTSNVSSPGFCYFEMYPGDEKAYITNFIAGWGGSPVDPATSLTYSNLAMFYAEKPANGAALDALRAVTNASPKAFIGLTDKADDPLSSYKVNGLENSGTDTTRTYCFVPALQDATGTFIYFTDFQGTGVTAEQQEKMCASPSEVVGVLSDKDCFIATVAFGSRNHVFLDVLRQFRNKFLHPYSWGKQFIKFYYKNGPGWAKNISENFWAKAAVKLALVPVIAIAFLLLNPIWFGVLGGLGFVVYRRQKYKGKL